MKNFRLYTLLALLLMAVGVKIQAQERRDSGLIITPDSLWLNEIGRCDEIIIRNFTTEPVTLSGTDYDHDTPIDVLLPYPCQYPYTIPVGDSIFLSVWLQRPFAGKGGYTPTDIQILTSLENRTVIAMMATSTLVDHGLILDSPINFYIPIPEASHLTGIVCNQNYGTLTPITIYSITEDGTDYFDIVPQHELPYDLPVKEYFRVDMYLRLDSKVPNDWIGTNIILESSAGQVTYSILFWGGILDVTTEITDEVKLYPNPTKDKVEIEGVDIIEVQVYNALGQLVKETKENIVDLSRQDAGIYIVKVITSSGIITKQIIKE